ncbi:MAG: thioredoxin domain-containing protein, partial [bacterium]|nr:thioredoxin domain-containing protein [bacterium]
SAEDADSEGIEGKFYLWTVEEIRGLLPEAEAAEVIDLFNVEAGGNFEEGGHGANILHLTGDSGERLDRLQSALTTMFEVREKRVHPYKDDKVLTDWNGLMIAALARAARVFDDPACLAAAEKAMSFNRKEMRTDQGRLLHRYREGSAGIDGGVDDYAFMVWGLIELYQSSFDSSWLKEALELNRLMLDLFWDEEHGGFYVSADDAESLIVRQKEGYDGAIPSGNSVAMLNLVRLGRITADPELER